MKEPEKAIAIYRIRTESPRATTMRSADVFDRTLMVADQYRMTAATPDRLVMTALSTSQHAI